MDVSRDCLPPLTPLKKSYYHGTSQHPLSSQTIGQLLQEVAESGPDHVIFKAPEFNQQLTLASLHKESNILSKAFVELGLNRGDVVMDIGVADIDSIIIRCAVAQIGLQNFSPTELEPYEITVKKYINMLCPSVVICGPRTPASLITHISGDHSVCPFKNLKKIIIYESNDHHELQVSMEKFRVTGTTINDEALDLIVNKVSPDDPAYLIETTGSTGERKFVMWSHFMMVNGGSFIRSRVCKSQADYEVLAYRNAITDAIQIICGIFTALSNWRNTVVVIAPSSISHYSTSSQIGDFMEFLQNEKVTFYVGYPFEWIRMIQHQDIDKYDLSLLRGGVLVSQLVTADTVKKLQAKFPDMLIGYGGSEYLLACTASATHTTGKKRIETAGYAFPHCEMAVIGENKEILPVGCTGEIVMRGFSASCGYLYNKDKIFPTSNSLGWISLGDIGKMDGTGHISVIGRKDDCIRLKTDGERIYPKALIDTAMLVKGVRNVKVIGTHQDDIGDFITVFIENDDDCKVQEEDLRKIYEERWIRSVGKEMPKQQAEAITKILTSQLNMAKQDGDNTNFKNIPHKQLEVPRQYVIMDKFPRIGSRNKIDAQKLEQIAEVGIKKMNIDTSVLSSK